MNCQVDILHRLTNRVKFLMDNQFLNFGNPCMSMRGLFF